MSTHLATPQMKHDAGQGGAGGPSAGRTPGPDPRRAKNVRTGLLLAAVAFGFFMLVVIKHKMLGA
ncbi:cytochrome oxidase small assembly protein [Rhodocyclaceae bacterium SMB388]